MICLIIQANVIAVQLNFAATAIHFLHNIVIINFFFLASNKTPAVKVSMGEDFCLLARDDELGRKLQDAGLPVRARAPRQKK